MGTLRKADKNDEIGMGLFLKQVLESFQSLCYFR